MKLIFSSQAWEDYLYWTANNPKVHQRVNELVKQTRRTPFQGIGKPKALRGDLSGWWSRRITHGDRMVYRVAGTGEGKSLEIAQLRFHY